MKCYNLPDFFTERRPLDRERALQLWREAKSILEDQRPSYEVTDPKSPVRRILLPPEDFIDAQDSEEKMRFMSLIMDLLQMSVISDGFKGWILSETGSAFDMGTPSDILMAHIGDLDKGEWDLFEVGRAKTKELATFEYWSRSPFWEMLSTTLPPISEERLQQMSLSEVQRVFVERFTGGTGETWPSKGGIHELFRGNVLFYKIWDHHINRAIRYLKWIRSVQSHYRMPGFKLYMEEVLARFVQYKLEPWER
jgi:hypothetical protein